MVLPIRAQSGKSIFFSLSRSGKDFSATERRLTELAQSHLALALSAGKSRPLTPDLLASAGFTPRESEVLCWLAEGKSNVVIATILHVQLSTVKGYLTSIYNKIGAGNRHAAILHVLDLARRPDPHLSSNSSSETHIRAPYLLTPTKVG